MGWGRAGWAGRTSVAKGRVRPGVRGGSLGSRRQAAGTAGLCVDPVAPKGGCDVGRCVDKAMGSTVGH